MRIIESMMGTMLALLPIVFVILFLGALGTVNVTFNKSYEQELHSCQTENQKVLDQREIYCAKEFGRPSSFPMVLGWFWAIFGFAIYGFANWRDNKKVTELNARESKLNEREKAMEKKKQ